MIVLWRVTEHCNLACGFCAYDRRLPGPRRQVDADTVLRLGAALGDYRRRTGERVLLSWLGGEPLLWRPLLAVSRTLHEQHVLAISATTNGTGLQRPDLRAGLLASFAELTVSVDGMADFHDRLRGGRGTWARLRAGVIALRAARDAATPRLRANVVLMRDNLAGFAELCLELADWGIDEITFNQLGGRDRPEFFPAHSLRPADVEALCALLPSLRARLDERGVRLCAGDAYLRRLAASAAQVPLPVHDCAPGERFLFIDEAGRIAPCSFTSDVYGVPVSAIADGRDLAGLASGWRHARSSARAAVCDDCPSTHVFEKFAG